MVGAPEANAPQETKTYYICPSGAAHGGWAWRGMCPKRHRVRRPECQYEPFGVSYKTADLVAHVEAAERKADEEGEDERKRGKAIKSARNTFFCELAADGIKEWLDGRGRAMVLCKLVDGCDRVRVRVPPKHMPGEFFGTQGPKGRNVARTTDGDYFTSAEEDNWELQHDARPRLETLACPVGPVPYPRPYFMNITLWNHRPSATEKANAAEAAAKAAADEAEAAAADEAEWAEQCSLAFGNDDDDDTDIAAPTAAPVTTAATAALAKATETDVSGWEMDDDDGGGGGGGGGGGVGGGTHRGRSR